MGEGECDRFACEKVRLGLFYFWHIDKEEDDDGSDVNVIGSCVCFAFSRRTGLSVAFSAMCRDIVIENNDVKNT